MAKFEIYFVHLTVNLSSFRMEPVELAELFVFMKQTAFICGDMIKEAFHKPKNIDTKSSEADLVQGCAFCDF